MSINSSPAGPVDPPSNERLGRTIRAVRGALMTQEDLGEAIGDITGSPIPQTTISRWELGLVQLSVEDVHYVELALDLEPGTILAMAGFVSVHGLDTEATILGDSRLAAPVREALAALYRSLSE